MVTESEGCGLRRIAAVKSSIPSPTNPPCETVLGEGPFKAAMSANIVYLLANSGIDDMLWLYRFLAGNPAPPGCTVGWESKYPSHAAQFLMGAGNTLRWQENPELRSRVDALIEGIKKCVQADGALQVPGVGSKLREQWGYSIQMFAHGMAAAAGAGNPHAWELLAAGHRAYKNLLRTEARDFPLTTDLNYQGHVTSLLAYLSPVGAPDDLNLAEKYFVSEPWLRDLAARRPEAIWKTCPKWPHAYEIIAFEAYLDHYRATGEKRFLEAMLGAWALIRENWEHAGGSIAICEGQEYPPKCYPLGRDRHVGELCGSVLWIRFNHRLHQIFPDDERYVEEIEKSIYNVCLAGQEPNGQGIHYHLLMEGRKREGDTFAQGPVPSQRHTCCEGNGTWLFGNLPEYVFSHVTEGLSVNLYHSAGTIWRRAADEVSVSVSTRFPHDGQVNIRVSAAKTTPMVLKLRIPRWCQAEVPVKVNDNEVTLGRPGTFLALDRAWNDGDTVSFRLPFSFRLHRYEGEARIAGVDRYAVEYGPLLLACVGSLDGGTPRIKNDPERPDKWLKPDPQGPLRFSVSGNTMHCFMPYWLLGDDEPFTCYPVIGMQ